MSFKSYINGLKIEEAKRILKIEKNIKIVELYKRVGFSNEVSFLRVLKKHVGMTPMQYKNKTFKADGGNE